MALRSTHGFGVALCVVIAACSSSTPGDDAPIDGDPAGVNTQQCKNGKKDGAEPDTDCGGTCATKCAARQACKADGDCASGLRCTKATCLPETANDGTRNGDETDTDCGGTATACADGKRCEKGSDCTSASCKGNVCQPPTSTDGVKNGTETDADCGGGAPTNAPPCETGKACAKHEDCVSNGCSDGKKVCVASPSCTGHFGGDTCGPNGDQSCCGSLPVPTAGGVQLDKFSITAGRMRTFIERVNGDVRGWVQSHRPAWWDAGWDQYLPIQLDGGDTFESINEQLGAGEYGKVEDANRGCWIGTGKDEIGARTYWLPADVNSETGSVQNYPQDELDQRALNCVTAYMVAAFCAWDGGRLPSSAELDAAWGNAKYPWGASPAPAGWLNALDTQQTANAGDTLWTNGLPPIVTCTYSGPTGPCDPLRANVVYNYWGGLTKKGNDYSLFIAPPGRFPKGVGPFGHADLAGLVFNVTTISNGKTAWSRNGSWQGHKVPYDRVTKTATNKYWSTGGRCAR